MLPSSLPTAIQLFLGCPRTHQTQPAQLAKVDSIVPSFVYRMALESVPPTQMNSPTSKTSGLLAACLSKLSSRLLYRWVTPCDQETMLWLVSRKQRCFAGEVGALTAGRSQQQELEAHHLACERHSRGQSPAVCLPLWPPQKLSTGIRYHPNSPLLVCQFDPCNRG